MSTLRKLSIIFSLFYLSSAFGVSLKSTEIKNKPLDPKAMLADPIEQFSKWYDEAKKAPDNFVFVLGTANASGVPSTRAMELTRFDKKGFVFFSNSQSFKAMEMKSSPFASMTFYWPALQKQINVKGKIELLTADESAAYFKTRSKESQLASHASLQGKEIKSRSELHDKFKQLQEKYSKANVPVHPNFQGYRLVPQTIEFWQAGPHALHDRIVYTLENNQWSTKILAP